MRRTAAFLVTLLVMITSMMHFSQATLIADSWESKAPMHEARSGLGVAVVNGRIYAIGGGIGRIGEYSQTNEEYDPATDTWKTKAPAPTPISSFGIAAYQNKIYCIGGITATNFSSPSGYAITAANHVYDPATDTWETKTPMPSPDWMIQANVVDGKIYVIGGTTSENRVYDPSTDTWTAKEPMPIKPQNAGGWSGTSSVLDQRIYAFVYSTLIYDSKTDNWTLGTSGMPAYAVASATNGVFVPKRIFVFGCDALNWGLITPTFSTRVYNPESDSWTTANKMSIDRVNPAVAVLNDTFFLIGGGVPNFGGGVTESAVNERYIPIGYGNINITSQTPTPSLPPTTVYSPSPTPPPSLTPSTSLTETPAPSLSSHPTPSASQTPTQSPKTTDKLPLEIWAPILVAAITIFAALTILVRKGRKTKA